MNYFIHLCIYLFAFIRCSSKFAHECRPFNLKLDPFLESTMKDSTVSICYIDIHMLLCSLKISNNKPGISISLLKCYLTEKSLSYSWNDEIRIQPWINISYSSLWKTINIFVNKKNPWKTVSNLVKIFHVILSHWIQIYIISYIYWTFYMINTRII